MAEVDGAVVGMMKAAFLMMVVGLLAQGVALAQVGAGDVMISEKGASGKLVEKWVPNATGVLTKNGSGQYEWVSAIPSTNLAATGVNAGPYGNSAVTFSLTVNEAGQITALTPLNVAPLDSFIQFGDITTGNASTSKHGLLPKLSGSATDVLKGNGTWGTVSASVAWGGITGTLSSQTDLQTALNAKLSTTTAASTYQPLNGNLNTLAAGFGGLIPGFLFWDSGTQTYTRATTIANSYLANDRITIGGTSFALGDSVTAAYFKTAISLNNVENTALSTWAGSSSITTIGANSVASSNIVNGTIVDADISASAAISNSKLATNPLARANHTGTQTLSTISDAGTIAALNSIASANITDGTIVDADISASAAISNSKLATNPLARANHTGTQAASTITALPEEIVVPCSTEADALTTGVKRTFRMPCDLTLTEVRLSVVTAPTGSVIIVNVKENGTTVFSTQPQIAISGTTSVGGAVPGVISDTALAKESVMTIEIVQIGSSTAGAGLKVTLVGTRNP